MPKLDPGSIAAGTAAWLRERVDLGPVVEFALKKTVPTHRASWIYVLGGAALFLFGLQVGTGALLTLYYQPTEAGAFESVRAIMTEVPYGWLIRSAHMWGAHLFIAIVVLHFLTTMFTAAYRKPRELTWLTGIGMLGLALAFGFTGYLLPWNELSYYATLVGTQIPGTVPWVGDWLVHLLRGGPQVSGATITRFFAAHVVFLPLGLGALLGVHLLLIQMQGMSVPVGTSKKKVRDHRPFITEFMIIDAALWLVLLGTILTLAVLLPGEMGVKPDPLQPAPKGIKPEWFFLFMFQTLKHVPEMLGVAFFGVCALFLAALPFLDRPALRERKSRPLSIALWILVAYAIVFEVIAIVAPGVEHPPEPLEAETYSLSWSLVSLAMVWVVIGFLLYCLRQLLHVNTRVRKLYSHAAALTPDEAPSSGISSSDAPPGQDAR